MERECASGVEIEVIYRFFGELFNAVDYREHKRIKTPRMMHRLLDRTHPTEREAATLTSVFRRAAEAIHGPDRFRNDES